MDGAAYVPLVPSAAALQALLDKIPQVDYKPDNKRLDYFAAGPKVRRDPARAADSGPSPRGRALITSEFETGEP